MQTFMKAGVAGAALAALLGMGPLASAVPLSARPTGPGIHYFGYFGTAADNILGAADGCPDGDSTPCVADNANITTVAALDPPEVARRLAEAQQLGMGAIVDASQIFFVNRASTAPNCAWHNDWDSLSQAIMPFASTIVGFYLADEPPPVTMNSLCPSGKNIIEEEVAAITTAFPNAHKLIIFEAKATLDDDSWTIPNGVDWVGYDCYPGTFQQCASELGTGWKSVPYYLGRLKSIIKKSNLNYKPGLVLVPQGYLTTDFSPANQAVALQRIEREISMVENDPDFVMILPFSWRGVVQLPMIRSYYSGLGKHLTTTTAPMRPAFPTSFSASNVAPGGDLVYAFDGDVSTAWNSGGYIPQWITASFADPLVLRSFYLTAAQSPAGVVRHLFSGTLVDGSSVSLGNYWDPMADGNTVGMGVLASVGALSSLTITTDISRSWVAWREVSLQTTGTSRVYGYPVGASAGSGSNRVENVIDSDPTTAWIPPASSPPATVVSVTLDLGQVQTLSRIQIQAYQSARPGTFTTHTVWAGPTTDNLTVVGTMDFRLDRQTIALSGPFANVRYVKISAPSPNVVDKLGWREINLYR